jgi:16S rRNA (guanine527-N7)-methyltransferase
VKRPAVFEALLFHRRVTRETRRDPARTLPTCENPGVAEPDRVLADASDLGVPLDRRGAERLFSFTALIRDRAIPLGMVASSDAPRVYERHVLDSLRAAPLIRPSDLLAYDLGSGAGLPGLVLAVVVPWCRFVLVESRSRRAGFLELAIERLELSNAEVKAARAEDLSAEADLATARAFGPVGASWKAALRVLRPGGRLIYFAGRKGIDRVLEAARKAGPEPPSRVDLAEGLANATPLVIMGRSPPFPR